MTENQEHNWNDMSLKSLEEELRRLPEVKVPEKLKTKLLAAIQSRQQNRQDGLRQISISHRLKCHFGARDLIATAAAAIFIFASMLMVCYGLPTPSQTLLTVDDLSLRYTMYDQNCVLIKDNNYTSYDEIK